MCFDEKKIVCNGLEPYNIGEVHSHKVQSYPLPIQVLNPATLHQSTPPNHSTHPRAL